jgi:hypothetical protein
MFVLRPLAGVSCWAEGVVSPPPALRFARGQGGAGGGPPHPPPGSWSPVRRPLRGCVVQATPWEAGSGSSLIDARESRRGLRRRFTRDTRALPAGRLSRAIAFTRRSSGRQGVPAGTRRCCFSSDSAASGCAKRCPTTAPLPRSRRLPLRSWSSSRASVWSDGPNALATAEARVLESSKREILCGAAASVFLPRSSALDLMSTNRRGRSAFGSWSRQVSRALPADLLGEALDRHVRSRPVDHPVAVRAK